MPLHYRQEVARSVRYRSHFGLQRISACLPNVMKPPAWEELSLPPCVHRSQLAISLRPPYVSAKARPAIDLPAREPSGAVVAEYVELKNRQEKKITLSGT